MRLTFALAILAALLSSTAHAAQPILKDNDTVALIGDSITNQLQYTVYIEDYLVMCQPAQNLRVIPFGTNSQTTRGFLEQESDIVLMFHPNVATILFGMNDGEYSTQQEKRTAAFSKTQTELVQKLKREGTRDVILASASCVDPDFFKSDWIKPDAYNRALAVLGDAGKSVAKEQTLPFADVHTLFQQTMTTAKAKYGPKYDLAGNDGIHPSSNGHLIIAYALLKSMACDGNIGTITVDLANNKADASAGHKILSFNKNTLDIESSRYPFCFSSQREPDKSWSTAGIANCMPFNDDLNRLTLLIKNLPGKKAKITWGTLTKEFSAEDLDKGINLAEQFSPNPFTEPFFALHKKIEQKQQAERELYHTEIKALTTLAARLPNDRAALQKITTDLLEEDENREKSIHNALTPIHHQLQIQPE